MMKIVKLGTICKMQSGGTPRRGTALYYKDGNIPWAKIGDIENAQNGWIYDTEERITELGLKSINNRLFPKGTLLFAMYGSVGKTSLTGTEMSSNQAILGIQPNKDILDVKYLNYWIKSRIKDFENQSRGVALKNLSATIMKDQSIPLPPLETQKKIAAILDKSDELRQNDKKILQKYDQLAQSVFLDMFGDPVVNPKKWKVHKFSEVGKLDRGVSKHRPRNASILLNGPYPLVQTGDVANSGGYIKTFKSTYSEIGLKQSRLWQKGTLCITIAANIAKTGILTFDACFPDSIVGFIPKSNTNNVYVQHWMSFLQKILEESAPESAQKNINLAILKDLDIPIPPVSLQNDFQNIVESINIQKEVTQKSFQKSEELFQSLLQRAFKGELI